MSGLRLSLGVVFLMLGVARAQNCDYSINAAPGSVYPVKSPNYPYSYPRGAMCRWCATCPEGYNCRLDCPEIDMPQSDGCYVDRLLVSRTGDPQLASATYYCGSGSLTNVLSVGQRMCVGLSVSQDSPGGRFSCQIRAQPISESACNCGYKKVSRIVGGEQTQVNEFPMMAGIRYLELDAIKCGATIISPKYLVTAAHCVASRRVADTGVIVGEHDVTTDNESPATQRFSIQSFKIHPQYTATNYQNDIAVVEVVGSIRFSALVGPACLPFKYRQRQETFAGAKLELLGWGTTEVGGPTSRVLRKVTVDGISVAQCRSALPNITSNQLCTYTPGKDACQDDSGGPGLYLDRAETGREYLIAISSNGRFCASEFPGVNTRVTAYLDFILSVAPDNYCNI